MSEAMSKAESPGDASRTPRHVAVIMDGNGRWATSRGRPRAFGHARGVEAVRKAVEAAGDLGVRYLTLFSFSTENWSRPADEVGALFELMRRYVDADLEKLARNGVRIRIIGRRVSRYKRSLVEGFENRPVDLIGQGPVAYLLRTLWPVPRSPGCKRSIPKAGRSPECCATGKVRRSADQASNCRPWR